MMILDLLERVCNKLDAANISYMLSGSLAMNIYTVPRMTRDIDIVVHLKLSDINTFSQLFSDGFYINIDGLEEEIQNEGMFNVIDFETGEKIDFIIKKSTEFHSLEFDRRVKTNVYGFDAWVVTAEDLIISKLKWIQELESDSQKRDISNLLTNPEIDLDYVKKWCRKLNLNTFNLIDL